MLLAALPTLAQAPSQAPITNSIPVKTVTLFTSGVSYIERQGEVDGDATVPLTFRTGQINDILKSMVLLDANGKVQPATYAAKDPISRALQSFAVDVTSNMTQEELLNKLRGVRVSVETANKGALVGQIVGVESRHVAGEDGKPITVPFLNLLGENGLTSIRLDAEKTVRILDERLNKEFRDALGLLASGSDDQRRQVTLHFSGQGKREVRVGYVTEAPLWKMTYRLLLNGDKAVAGDKPYIQGWALVENTTDDDWKDVKLTLVSGRPVSFIQDLYQPLYLPRPVVAPDVIASPTPQTHAGNMLDDKRVALAEKPAEVMDGAVALRKEAKLDALSAADASAARRMGRGLGAPGAPGGGGFGGGGGRGAGGMGGAGGEPAGINGPLAFGSTSLGMSVRDSVDAQASGASLGELFQYNISSLINLPRQQAAMIPVVAQDIETEKVSLFNADNGIRFPMNAVRVKNTTKLHLKGGPVTLFDDGAYAGDAKMEDIPPGDSRLVTYAVDLSIEGERQNPKQDITETSLSLRRGVLTVTRKERTETTYTVKSKAPRERKVIIEHPFNASYKLLEPAKADERTPALYRFNLNLPAGKSQELKVVLERPISQTVAIMDTDLNGLAFYANRKDISQKLKDTLQDVVQRRRRVQEIQAQAAGKDQAIKAIEVDQDRIRKNMAALDKMSALYKRYVTELDNQETQIQNLRKEAAKLRNEAATADAELRAYLDGLTIAE
jgi:hypothetical protein